MKRFHVILLLVLLASPSFAQKHSAADTSGRSTVFAKHPISFYLSNSHIPKVCKDLYLNNRLPTDDNDVLSLFDSIVTNNTETRPFYFLTLTRTMKNADGAYSEALGAMAKEFVEKRTVEFLTYFTEEPLLTKDELSDWANAVASEIQIEFEGKELKEAQTMNATMKTHCRNTTPAQQQRLDEFMQLVYADLKASAASK